MKDWKRIGLAIVMSVWALEPCFAESEVAVHDTFVVKTLDHAGGDYREFVILLHEAYDGVNKLGQNYAVGRIFTSRGSSGSWNIKRVVQVNTGSAYLSNHGSAVSMDMDGKEWQLVFVNYQSVKYLAIKVPYQGAYMPRIQFEGFHVSTAEGLKTVSYYNPQSNIVLNQEVYDSISPFAPTMTQVVDAKLTRFKQGVEVERDLSVLGSFDAGSVFASGNIVSDGKLSVSAVTTSVIESPEGGILKAEFGDLRAHGLSRFYGEGGTMPRFHFTNPDSNTTWQLGSLGGTTVDSFSIGAYAGNSGNLTITKEGNVGIGNKQPDDRLDVAGNVQISGDLRVDGTFRNSVWRPFGSASDDFYLDVEPGSRMLRTRNWNADNPNVAATGIHTGKGVFEGYVGIGTNSVNYPLTIDSKSTSPTLAIDEADSSLRAVELWGTSTGGQIRIYDDDVLDNYISGTGQTYFQADRSHGVGIGTSNPQAMLDVNGQFRVTNSGPIPTTGRGLEMYWNGSVADIFAYDRGVNAMQPLRLRGSKILFEDGNVGIGASVPGYNLVIGEGGASPNLRMASWTFLGEEASHNTTLLGNNARISGSSSVVSGSTVDGYRAIRMKYSDGITFHAYKGAVTGGALVGYERMRIAPDGHVTIGSTKFVNGEDGATLSVGGKIRAEEIVVKLQNSWADYVFEDGYKLRSLEEVEAHIAENGHLPGVPSAAEIAEHGVSIGDNQRILMEKIEELTLYVIELKKENEDLKSGLLSRIEKLESQQ